jgi:hypothetical protein
MDINGNTIIDRYIREENRLITNNPLGHRPIKDIDETMCRSRRQTDDPYIKLLKKKQANGKT